MKGVQRHFRFDLAPYSEHWSLYGISVGYELNPGLELLQATYRVSNEPTDSRCLRAV